MREIAINTSKPYSVYISNKVKDFANVIRNEVGSTRIAVITDAVVDNIYGKDFFSFLKSVIHTDTRETQNMKIGKVSCFGGKESRIVKLVIPSGEREKNGQNYLSLVNALAEFNFQRTDTVIAFGGGVVGDLAGFTASTFTRGIKLISIPTTILSMVDSSVGGKTAIDLDYGKNLCGTFYQPTAVLINVAFVDSLPEREVLSGLGEVAKYEILFGKRLISSDVLKNHFSLENCIYECVSYKKTIVETDEFESGRRMLLNLGHTVGHSIEKLSNYSLSHGECVIKGLFACVKISQQLYGNMDAVNGFLCETLSILDSILEKYSVDTSTVFSVNDIAETVKLDKKSRGEIVKFVAVKGLGDTPIIELKIDEIKGLLQNE